MSRATLALIAKQYSCDLEDQPDLENEVYPSFADLGSGLAELRWKLSAGIAQIRGESVGK